MKIKALTSFATARFAPTPGQEYEVDDDFAAEFIKLGWVEEVKATTPAKKRSARKAPVETASTEPTETATDA